MPIVKIRYPGGDESLYLCHDGSPEGLGPWPRDGPHPLANLSDSVAQATVDAYQEAGVEAETVSEEEASA